MVINIIFGSKPKKLSCSWMQG